MPDAKENRGGKRAGAGRKPKAVENDLAQLLSKAWPKQKRLEAIKKLADQASDGDKEAAKILLAYSYGRPTERKEISGPNGGDIPISIIEFHKAT